MAPFMPSTDLMHEFMSFQICRLHEANFYVVASAIATSKTITGLNCHGEGSHIGQEAPIDIGLRLAFFNLVSSFGLQFF